MAARLDEAIFTARTKGEARHENESEALVRDAPMHASRFCFCIAF